MRRLLVVLALMLMAGWAAAPAAWAQMIMLSPGAGHQNDEFVFSGDGFAPNTPLDFLFTAPNGQQFELQTAKGQPAVWVTDGNGTFSFSIIPSIDFAGAPAGHWRTDACIDGTQTCWFGSFEILP